MYIQTTDRYLFLTDALTNVIKVIVLNRVLIKLKWI
jgi:hypothetical protein